MFALASAEACVCVHSASLGWLAAVRSGLSATGMRDRERDRGEEEGRGRTDCCCCFFCAPSFPGFAAASVTACERLWQSFLYRGGRERV